MRAIAGEISERLVRVHARAEPCQENDPHLAQPESLDVVQRLDRVSCRAGGEADDDVPRDQKDLTRHDEFRAHKVEV